MSDTNEREFEAWAISQHAKGYQENLTWNCWQAATASSDARYQARVRELEEALDELVVIVDGAIEDGAVNRSHIDSFTTQHARKALSATPDIALQCKVLEARIDEVRIGRTAEYLPRLAALNNQLAALNSNKTLGG